MSDGTPPAPTDLPDELAARLRGLDDHHLRETLLYARELLQHRRADTGPEIEPEPGEVVVAIAERDGYTAVAKREPCGNDCPDCPHGPYLYYVSRERHPDGGERTHWTLIGRISEEQATELGREADADGHE